MGGVPLAIIFKTCVPMPHVYWNLVLPRAAFDAWIGLPSMKSSRFPDTCDQINTISCSSPRQLASVSPDAIASAEEKPNWKVTRRLVAVMCLPALLER